MERVRPFSGAQSRFQEKLRTVEDDLARLRGARERMVSVGVKARMIADDINDELTSYTSEDGVATVTCDGRGHILRVVLDSAGYNKVDEQRLCAAVLQARQRARERARSDANRAAAGHASYRSSSTAGA